MRITRRPITEAEVNEYIHCKPEEITMLAKIAGMHFEHRGFTSDTVPLCPHWPTDDGGVVYGYPRIQRCVYADGQVVWWWLTDL